jgi:hypothetical protein
MAEKEKRAQTNRERLAYIADRIASERPNTTIILNELIEADERGFGRGYKQRISDSRKFKEAQNERRAKSWDNVKMSIEDKCSKATIESTNENTSNE